MSNIPLSHIQPSRDIFRIASVLNPYLEQAHQQKYLSGGTTKIVGTDGKKALAIYLSARAKTNPLRSTWDKLTLRRNQQNQCAVLGLSMVMRAIEKNESLYERSDVRQAMLEISGLLSSGSSREERIKVSQLRPHFKTIVAAESEVVQEHNDRMQERIDGLLAKAQQPSTLASQAIVDRFVGGLELYTHEGKVHSHLSNLYGSCNYYLTEPGERKPMLGKARLIVPGDSGIHHLFQTYVAAAEKGTVLQEALQADVGEQRIFLEATKKFVMSAQQQLYNENEAQNLTGVVGLLADRMMRSVDDLGARLFRGAEAESGDLVNPAREMKKLVLNHADIMRFNGSMLTNQKYLESLPAQFRGIAHSYGLALQEFALSILDPESCFMHAVRLCQEVEKSPESAEAVRKALASAVEQAKAVDVQPEAQREPSLPQMGPLPPTDLPPPLPSAFSGLQVRPPPPTDLPPPPPLR